MVTVHTGSRALGQPLDLVGDSTVTAPAWHCASPMSGPRTRQRAAWRRGVDQTRSPAEERTAARRRPGAIDFRHVLVVALAALASVARASLFVRPPIFGGCGQTITPPSQLTQSVDAVVVQIVYFGGGIPPSLTGLQVDGGYFVKSPVGRLTGTNFSVVRQQPRVIGESASALQLLPLPHHTAAVPS